MSWEQSTISLVTDPIEKWLKIYSGHIPSPSADLNFEHVGETKHVCVCLFQLPKLCLSVWPLKQCAQWIGNASSLLINLL